MGMTFGIYLVGQFLTKISIAFAVCLGLIFIFDLMELLRRSAKGGEASFALLSGMAALHTPSVAEKALPFAVLFGAMWAFLMLTRSNELVVARAAGVSVWQFLLPMVLVGAFLGLFAMTAYNPVAAAMVRQFETYEAKYIRGRTSLLTVSPGGLWLRQNTESGPSVIHALRAYDGGQRLEDVTIYRYRGTDLFVSRFDSQSAVLKEGHWELNDVWRSEPNKPPVELDRVKIETPLTLDQIQESFAPPETLSFWELPGFIQILEESGFTATRHRLHWHALISLPILLCAMIIVAATFSLRIARLGGMATMVGGCVFSGFILYFLTDLSLAMGLNGVLPAMFAAWTPAVVATLLALTTLFHLEDG